MVTNLKLLSLIINIITFIFVFVTYVSTPYYHRRGLKSVIYKAPQDPDNAGTKMKEWKNYFSFPCIYHSLV